MSQSKTVIKQISNPDNPKLGIKYVEAKEYMTPKQARDGKMITGLDESSLEIINLPAKEKELKQKEVKKLREDLQRLLGIQDLSSESSYWDNFYVVLQGDDEIDEVNPLDRLKVAFLIANRYIAPSLEAIETDDRYADCMFYLSREGEEISKKAATEYKKDKAISILVSLREVPAKLKLVYTFVFGYDARVDVSPEECYLKLKEFLTTGDKKVQRENLDSFLAAADKTPEEMMTKSILDRAIKKKIVTSRKNVFRRDDFIYGDSYEAALEFLAAPDNSGELTSLKKAVEKI